MRRRPYAAVRRKRPLARVACAVSALLLVLGMAWPLVSCARLGTYTTTYLDTFDTVLTITVGAHSREQATAWTVAIHDRIRALHEQFDIYHHHDGMTNLYDVNAAAGAGRPLTVSDDIIALLQLGRELCAVSGGQVNICMGAVLRLWHEARAAGDTLPDADALSEALTEHSSPEALVVDEDARTVYIRDPQASLDVGAVAKGYVMAEIQAYAAEVGIESLLVNLGGHVLAVGHHPDGDSWTVAVRNPMDGTVLDTLAVTNASVVTSGDDQRSYTVDGQSYHHLIDATTAYPAQYHHAVTVVLPLSRTAEADGYSTALFLLPTDEGQALLTDVPGATAIWVEPDGQVVRYEASS